MFFAQKLKEMEVLGEFFFKLVDGVTYDGEAAACDRAVLIEGGDDEVALIVEVVQKSAAVGKALLGFGQKMKDCPVMPERIGSRELDGEDIVLNKCHVLGAGAKALAGALKGLSGKIEKGKI